MAGHSNEISLEGKLNGEADFLATSAQKVISELLYAPILVLSKGFGNPTGTWVRVWRVGVRVRNS